MFDTPILDNFNRANEGPPATGWTTWIPGGLKVVSNQLAPNDAGDNAAYWTTGMTSSDVEAYITIATEAASALTRLYARFDPALSNGYRVEHFETAPDSIALIRSDAGADTILGSWNQELSNGDKIGIRCVRHQISAWVFTGGSWQQLGAVTDARHDGTGPKNKFLLYSALSAAVRYDDFGGGEVSAVVIPTVKVEVAFHSNPLAPNLMLDDSAWEDITPYVMSIDCHRGYGYETGQIEAGTATLRLNNSDRRFDSTARPESTHGVSSYSPGVVPYRAIRIRAPGYGITENIGINLGCIWTGFVERWPTVWEEPFTGFVDITCVDAIAMLARSQIATSFSQERTDQRIGNVVGAVGSFDFQLEEGWALGSGALDSTTELGYSTTILNLVGKTGQSSMGGVTFAVADNKAALDHIREALVTEGVGSAFFVRADGKFMFLSRWDAYVPFTEAPGDYTKPTYTDGALGANRYPYVDLQPSYDIDRVMNELVVTNSDETTFTSSDGGSIDRYGRRSLPIATQFPGGNPEILNDFGLWELTRRKEPTVRFDAISVRPITTEAWNAAISLEIGAQVVVERTFPNIEQSDDMTKDMLVESITHSIRPGNDWTVSYGLYQDFSRESPSTPWFQLGTSDLAGAANEAQVLVGSELQLGAPLLAF